MCFFYNKKLGMGYWVLVMGPNPQSPIPNPHLFSSNSLKILNPSKDHHVDNVEAVYYTDKPVVGMKENEAADKAMQ